MKLYLSLGFILAFGVPLTVYAVRANDIASAGGVVLLGFVCAFQAVRIHTGLDQAIAPSATAPSRGAQSRDQTRVAGAAQGPELRPGTVGEARNYRAVTFWILPPLLAVVVMFPLILSRGEGSLGERLASLALFAMSAVFVQWIVYRWSRRNAH